METLMKTLMAIQVVVMQQKRLVMHFKVCDYSFTFFTVFFLVLLYQEQLQKEMKEKEQIQQDLQERDEQVQALIQEFNEDTTHLKETKAKLEAHIDQLQKELQEERQLMSRLMEQKGKEAKTDTVSEKDEEIKSLKNKLEEEKKEEKKLRQELQEKVESLQQQLQQFIIPQSGMCVCVCTGSRYDVSVLFQI